MKINNMLMALLLSITCSSIEAYVIPSIEATEYERVVIVSKQNYPYAPVSPLDPHHAAMLSSGIFSQQEIDLLDSETIADLYAQYGIDMSDANPNVVVDPNTGIRALPGVATMLPAVFGNVPGQPWFVVHDSENPNREYKWVHYEYTALVIFSSNFTVPAGPIQAGAHVTANSIFFSAYMIQGKTGKDWAQPKFREVFRNYCTQLTVQSNNMWGNIEYAITYPFVDKEGNVGFGLSTTTEANIPADSTGIPHVEGRIILTW
jgi:hypothetical protein